MPRFIASFLCLAGCFAPDFALAQSPSQTLAAATHEPDFFSEMAWRERDGWGLWVSTTEFELAVNLDRPLDDERFERFYRVTRTAQNHPTIQITSMDCPAIWTVLRSAAELTEDLSILLPAVQEPPQGDSPGVIAHAPLYDLWLGVLFGDTPAARMRLTANIGPLAQFINEAEDLLAPCWLSASAAP